MKNNQIYLHFSLFSVINRNFLISWRIYAPRRVDVGSNESHSHRMEKLNIIGGCCWQFKNRNTDEANRKWTISINWKAKSKLQSIVEINEHNLDHNQKTFNIVIALVSKAYDVNNDIFITIIPNV